MKVLFSHSVYFLYKKGTAKLLTALFHAQALISKSFIRYGLPLFSVQCEWALGQRIHVISGIMQSLRASTPSSLAALRAARVWIGRIADFNLAVEKHVRVFADVLEGFQAETLRLQIRTGVELQSIIHFATEKKSKIVKIKPESFLPPFLLLFVFPFWANLESS